MIPKDKTLYNSVKKMIDTKNKLGSKHLITEDILKTKKFNVK